jgi:predicted DsbA family dithiol-disulfide isomerase
MLSVIPSDPGVSSGSATSRMPLRNLQVHLSAPYVYNIDYAASFTDKLEVEVRWRPFFLNANASKVPTNKLEMYHQKFGKEKVEQMVPFMVQKFASIGIDYKMGGDVGNTMDSHRVIAYAEDFGSEKQNVRV